MKNLSRIDEPKDLLTKEYLDENLPKIFGGGKNILLSRHIIDRFRQNTISTNKLNVRAWALTIVDNASLREILTPGETYTLSWEAKLVTKGSNQPYVQNMVGLMIYSPSTQRNVVSRIENPVSETLSLKTTFVCPELVDDHVMLVYTARYDSGATLDTYEFSIKIEKGELQTPWTPAPEDILDRLAKIEQKIGM